LQGSFVRSISFNDIFNECRALASIEEPSRRTFSKEVGVLGSEEGVVGRGIADLDSLSSTFDGFIG